MLRSCLFLALLAFSVVGARTNQVQLGYKVYVLESLDSAAQGVHLLDLRSSQGKPALQRAIHLGQLRLVSSDSMAALLTAPGSLSYLNGLAAADFALAKEIGLAQVVPAGDSIAVTQLMPILRMGTTTLIAPDTLQLRLELKFPKGVSLLGANVHVKGAATLCMVQSDTLVCQVKMPAHGHQPIAAIALEPYLLGGAVGLPAISYAPVMLAWEPQPVVQPPMFIADSLVLAWEPHFSPAVHVDSVVVQLNSGATVVWRSNVKPSVHKIALSRWLLPWNTPLQAQMIWFANGQVMYSPRLSLEQKFPDHAMPTLAFTGLGASGKLQGRLQMDTSAGFNIPYDKLTLQQNVVSSPTQGSPSALFEVNWVPQVDLCIQSIGLHVCRSTKVVLPDSRRFRVLRAWQTDLHRSVRIDWQLDSSFAKQWITGFDLVSTCPGAASKRVATASRDSSGVVVARDSTALCLRILPRLADGSFGVSEPLLSIASNRNLHDIPMPPLHVVRTLRSKHWVTGFRLDSVWPAHALGAVLTWMDSIGQPLLVDHWSASTREFTVSRTLPEGADLHCQFRLILPAVGGTERVGPAREFLVHSPVASLPAVRITQTQIIRDSVEIHWEYPVPLQAEIQSFQVYVERKAQWKKALPPQVREARFACPVRGAYALEIRPLPLYLPPPSAGIQQPLIVP